MHAALWVTISLTPFRLVQNSCTSYQDCDTNCVVVLPHNCTPVSLQHEAALSYCICIAITISKLQPLANRHGEVTCSLWSLVPPPFHSPPFSGVSGSHPCATGTSSYHTDGVCVCVCARAHMYVCIYECAYLIQERFARKVCIPYKSWELASFLGSPLTLTINFSSVTLTQALPSS